MNNVQTVVAVFAVVDDEMAIPDKEVQNMEQLTIRIQQCLDLLCIALSTGVGT